jgi:Leucine-rich repeat (LRR) protein
MDELPPFLANLTNLVSLDAEGYGLCKLPEWMGTIKNLKRLNVSGNNIEDLPEWLWNLTNLEELAIENNESTDIPAFIGNLPRLKKLSLGGGYPWDAVKNAKTADEKKLLEEQKYIKTLPGSIGNLRPLETLSISRLSGPLPDSIGNLSNLRELYLSDARIDRLPETIDLFNNHAPLSKFCQ